MNYVEPIRNLADVKKIAKELRPKFRLVWEIGTNIGLRVSDILNLKIKDILDKTEVTIKEQKTGKTKRFPVKPELQQKIREYYEKYCDGSNPNEYFFLGDRYKKLNRSTVYKEFNAVCKKWGIAENVGTHTMRKTFGYHHYKQFKDVALLQTIFNHSAPTITLRYIGITQEEINQSYNSFNLDSSINLETRYALTQERELKEQYRNRTTKLHNMVLNVCQNTQTLLETIKNNTIVVRPEIKEVIKYEIKEIVKHKTKPSDQYALKVVQNLKNYLENGGGKHSAFCELMLTVD